MSRQWSIETTSSSFQTSSNKMFIICIVSFHTNLLVRYVTSQMKWEKGSWMNIHLRKQESRSFCIFSIPLLLMQRCFFQRTSKVLRNGRLVWESELWRKWFPGTPLEIQYDWLLACYCTRAYFDCLCISNREGYQWVAKHCNLNWRATVTNNYMIEGSMRESSPLS